MSFAIFKTGGKQYKVQTSQILKIEKLESPDNKKIEFNEILAYGNKEKVELGSPLIKGAKIEAELIKNSKERTILVFKKRRRKNSRKKYGHRQQISLIKITKIFSKEGKLISQAELKKEKTPVKTEKLKEEPTRKMKAEGTRRLQQEETKKFDKEEKQSLKKAQKRIKLQAKKSSLVKKKTISKKKSLTTKKK